MLNQTTYELRANTLDAHLHLSRLERAVRTASPSLKEVLESLFDLPDFFQKLFAFNGYFGSAPANKQVITLEPTDLFRRVLAAILANDIDALVVEHTQLLEQSDKKKV